MGREIVDRIAHVFAGEAHRREAIRAFAGTGLAGLATRLGLQDSEAKKKKKCRKRRQSCGGKKKCCDNNTACHEFPTDTCGTLSGRHCCGLEGAPCENVPGKNNCDCCDGLFCGGTSGEGLCQEAPS